MSALNMADRQNLEKLLGMSSGYVLNFSDRTFQEFVFEAVGVDIHSECYTAEGTSKGKKLRTFWKIESDHLVGKLLLALIDYSASLTAEPTEEDERLAEKCRQIANRLLTSAPRLTRETFDRLTEKPEHRLLDRVIVKGKTEPLELFEVHHSLLPKDFNLTWEAFANAFVLYQRGAFAEAARGFRRLCAEDHASLVLAQRCEELSAHPPSSWSGIYKLESK